MKRDKLSNRGAILASILLIFVGCSDGQVIEVDAGICRRGCLSRFVNSLSSIDHEQPSGEALRVLDESCRETGYPCCMRVGAREIGTIGPHRTTCIPGQYLPLPHPASSVDK